MMVVLLVMMLKDVLLPANAAQKTAKSAKMADAQNVPRTSSVISGGIASEQRTVDKDNLQMLPQERVRIVQ
jgi:hypothetical protein